VSKLHRFEVRLQRTSMLRCPLCHLPLEVTEKSAHCARGHGFDRAREGYFNLLPVQHKNSLHPGDDAAMVAARRAFLEAGFYTPLRDTLCGLLAPLQPAHLLDSGCGEGWYTAALARHAGHTTALDISKDAVKRAARRERAITWLVASSADLPLPDAGVDAMTAIFSPLAPAEVWRVLAPGGSLIVVAPGENHLLELRQALYEQVRPHQPEKWLDDMAPALAFHSEIQLRFDLRLPDNGSVNALLQMTPHYWRAPRERRQRVAELQDLAVRADFRLLRFVRAS
jgi:23S rRNA (guanine745-N1)-methyltransferase